MKRYALLWPLCLLGLNACHATEASATIDLASASPAAHVTLVQVQRTGGAEQASDGVMQQRYAFQPSAQPQITIAPGDGKTWDWTGRGELRLRVQNAMPWAVTLNLDIDSAAGAQHLHATVGLPAGPAQTVVLPLHAESPRGEGMQAPPPMPFDDRGQPTLLATTV